MAVFPLCHSLFLSAAVLFTRSSLLHLSANNTSCRFGHF